MNIEQYKSILLAKHEEVAAAMERANENARMPGDEGVQDRGDRSVADEQLDEQLSTLDRESTLGEQVEEALSRIEAGTFGLCEVDGEPIEEKRLQQVPWATRCLHHQEIAEKDEPKHATL